MMPHFCYFTNYLRIWPEKYPTVIPVALYTYLRLIEDHDGQQFLSLRQMEIDFCIGLLRDKVIIILYLFVLSTHLINISCLQQFCPLAYDLNR